jgi:hypothetical protein
MSSQFVSQTYNYFDSDMTKRWWLTRHYRNTKNAAPDNELKILRTHYCVDVNISFVSWKQPYRYIKGTPRGEGGCGPPAPPPQNRNLKNRFLAQNTEHSVFKI